MADHGSSDHSSGEHRLIEPREVPLGGVRGVTVHRTLPHRDLPTIGAWCFVDHFGPKDQATRVLPHPHTGLQTVTWPIHGEIRHRDDLGSDVVLRPGELNLMTSGEGVSHSEMSVGSIEGAHAVQLWVALPDGVRHGGADFEHRADLPRIAGEGWTGIVLVGELAGGRSTARTHSPLVGAQLSLSAGASVVPIDPAFEHGVLALDGDLEVLGEPFRHRELSYWGTGRRELTLRADEPRTVLLIGGEPFGEDLVMWWNFIGRNHDEIAQAREDWERERLAGGGPRFGHVDGHDGETIPAPPLPNARLRSRRRIVEPLGP